MRIRVTLGLAKGRFSIRLSHILGISTLFVMTSTAFSMPYGLGCATDINTDGNVGVGDVLSIIDYWGTSNEAADCNGDGIVSIGDLLMLIDEWGTDCNSIHPFTASTVVTFDYANGFVIIETNGIPDHPTGPFDGSTIHVVAKHVLEAKSVIKQVVTIFMVLSSC